MYLSLQASSYKLLVFYWKCWCTDELTEPVLSLIMLELLKLKRLLPTFE